MSWKNISDKAQQEVLDRIPQKWRIDRTKYETLTNVINVPRTAGILTEKQLIITELTVTELSAKISSRELKAVEVLEAFAARTAIAHQLANCLCAWFLDEGMSRAEELDAILEKGGQPVGPLHGIPVCIKDTYDLNGHPSTFGYVSKRDQMATRDSAVVKALRQAGAVFYVKTTMPQTGMALETSSNLWGRTLNPFNTKLVAGGSSGGDACLVALHGCPIAPATDIGGSIRAPAAFNGLYAIRPTADRIPKGGMRSTETGQISIRVSCGPVCHSMEDVELFTKVINAYPVNKHDVTCTPIPWRDVPLPEKKLAIGIMKWDGVVMPQPPVLRAIEHARKVITTAGFEVVDFEPPFDCWEAAQTTFDLYFQTGAKETLESVNASGEPLLPAFGDILKVFNARSQSAADVLQSNIKTRQYKEAFAKAWDDTAQRTSTSRPIDALILPPAPSAGFPHDFNVYWGYTSLLNIIDYPSTILPVTKFQVDKTLDVADRSYEPLTTNPYDLANQEMYDPDLFVDQPVCIQVAGRPFEDEELIAVTTVIDKLFKSA